MVWTLVTRLRSLTRKEAKHANRPRRGRLDVFWRVWSWASDDSLQMINGPFGIADPTLPRGPERCYIIRRAALLRQVQE
jgi:hypothetical protein